MQTGQRTASAKVPRNLVTCLKYLSDKAGSSASSSSVVQGGEDLRLRVWDVREAGLRPSVTIEGYTFFPVHTAVVQHESDSSGVPTERQSMTIVVSKLRFRRGPMYSRLLQIHFVFVRQSRYTRRLVPNERSACCVRVRCCMRCAAWHRCLGMRPRGPDVVQGL